MNMIHTTLENDLEKAKDSIVKIKRKESYKRI